MTELKKILSIYLDLYLHQIIISGARTKEGASKIRIRPVVMKDKLYFQCTSTVGTKEIHENYEKERLLEAIEGWITTDFRQLQLESELGSVNVLSSKKGKLTIKEKKKKIEGNLCDKPIRMEALSHNRKKRYILEEGKPVEFLIDLGVMTREGKIVHSRYDKFRQINRFLEFIEDILPKLSKDREVTILDFGCGKSYLTFAMYYYLHQLQQYDVRIVGLDLKEDVIEKCSALAKKYGYKKLTFCQGDIASYEGVDRVDMVVTLHACDTATDYALAKAVGWGASVILSVPCCQHELNRQIFSHFVDRPPDRFFFRCRSIIVPVDQMCHLCDRIVIKLQSAKNLFRDFFSRRTMPFKMIHTVCIGRPHTCFSNIVKQHRQTQDPVFFRQAQRL